MMEVWVDSPPQSLFETTGTGSFMSASSLVETVRVRSRTTQEATERKQRGSQNTGEYKREKYNSNERVMCVRMRGWRRVVTYQVVRSGCDKEPQKVEA